jgi:hypothetical protein
MHAGAASALEYDALNRRVGRQDGPVWTEYVHDPGSHLLAELTRPVSGSWTTVREYAWLDGQPLAQLEYLQSRVAPYLYYVRPLPALVRQSPQRLSPARENRALRAECGL